MKKPPPTFDHVKAAAMLKFMREPDSVPFYTIAAERAGLSRQSVRNWVHRVEHAKDPDKLDPVLVAFVTEIRRIRAEWVAEATRFLRKCGSADREAAKQTAWLLARLDRENFDPPKNEPAADEDDKPKDPKTPPDDKDVASAVEDLGKPEVAEFSH